MSILQGEKAQKFISWLSCIKGFLPKSMSIKEASELFLRYYKDLEKEEQHVEKKNS